MLKSIIKYRPTSLHVVYVEPHRIEVIQAHRHWRSWEIGVAEQSLVPRGESVFDHLQYLNLKPKSRKGSALLAIVSSVFYSVHSEYYPLSIKDQLGEAINFDWQENIFLEHDRTLHFSGPPVALNQHVSVPVFSIQREIYDKLNQALNGELFHTFAVAPSALSFSALLPLIDDGGKECEIIVRGLDDEDLEVHRFYRGAFLNSAVVGKSFHGLKLFGENLKCLGNEEFGPHIHLVCAPGESNSPEGPAAIWAKAGLPVKAQEIPESLVTSWLRNLLKQDAIHTFDSEILLKPWQIPRIAAPLAALIFIFALYGLYQSHSISSMVQTSNALKVQIHQLEARWKPIEQIQTRITKFQEDQKTLSQFKSEDYQLLELLSFLTRLTPGDTWLNYFSLRQGQLILRGESKSAIKYLTELSKTEGFSDVKFASPVTRDPGTDMERFNVQLQLDMEKLKKNFEALPPETPGEVLSEGPAAEAAVTEKGLLEGPPSPAEEHQAGETPQEGAAAGEQAPEESAQ
ncbi:MAG: PilN domain-containing protein [Syntrophobacteraceae bacterium]